MVASCASLPDIKPVHPWVFDRENNQMVNSRAEVLNMTSSKLDSFTCFNKEDFKIIYIRMRGHGSSSVDTNTTLEKH